MKIEAAEDGRLIADQALELWLQIALEARPGHAHYATEQAIMPYRHLMLNQEALAAADRFVAAFTAQGSTSKIAFAEYMRVQALHWAGRPREAIEASWCLDETYAAGDDELQAIRAYNLLLLSHYYAMEGDIVLALEILDRLESRRPGAFLDSPIARYRQVVLAYGRQQGL